MEPSKQTIYQLFDREIRYIVPLYQRAYVWQKETHWEPLWEDIERLARVCLKTLKDEERSETTHFLGAVVLNNAKITGLGHARSEVIDGQQRLTTLQIFLAALRDYASVKNHSIAGSARRLTENPVDGDLIEERYKVWPTNADRNLFAAVMLAGSPDALQNKLKEGTQVADLLIGTRLAEAYFYFHDAIKRFVEEDSNSTEKLSAIMLALKKPLQLIKIELDEKDDPQVIFETLNARGQPLQPSDLIRNFVFLQASLTKANTDNLYNSYWQEFDSKPDDEASTGRFWHEEERQGRLTRPRLDLFVFHYLVMKTGEDIQIGHLYKAFQTWYKGWNGNIEDFLKDLLKYRSHFAKLIKPTGDSQVDEFAKRLKSLDTSTVYPILLYLMGMPYEVLPTAHKDEIVGYLESWLVRRFVCGLTPKNYNRFFLSLLNKMQKAVSEGDSLPECVLSELTRAQDATTKWPNNEEFRKGWLNNPVYVKSRSDRSAMLLKALNKQSYTGRSEQINWNGSDISVEHLLPQKSDLGLYPYSKTATLKREDETLDLFRKRLIDTVGNLTLITQPLNSAISNGAFPMKAKAIAEGSDLRINAEFRNNPQELWDEESIIVRGDRLFKLALDIWPYPNQISQW